MSTFTSPREQPVPLDVLACPLDGICLIEASAGTGKTWAICGLVLRLLLERGLEIQRILVVTFTHAATAELRDRIRQRVVDTLAYLRSGASASGDDFIARLVELLRRTPGLDDDTMIKRLDLALAGFDEAAIYTIHGFCHRALADAPFAAQVPLAIELVEDDSELVSQAANDFWRRRVAGDDLDPALAAYLVKCKDSPEKFARLLERHLAKPAALARWPSGIDSPGEIDRAALNAAHGAARTLWVAQRPAIVQCIRDALPSLNQRSYTSESIAQASSDWDALLQGHDGEAALAVEASKADLFGQTRLGERTHRGKTPPAHAFFAAAQALLDARSIATTALRLGRLRLLRELTIEASRALREGKRQRRVVAFDDMLFNLHQRLTGGDAPGLAGSLRTRFPAALIDEFQDTDPLQFAIFKSVYDAPGHPLFLVGDPKQAIYRFRNADLHTYLQARSQASAEYTLVDNQRSTGALLAALNGLFGANPQAFMLPGLEYREVGLGSKPRRPLVDVTEPRAALQVWTLPNDPGTGQPMTKADAQQRCAQSTAAEIARLLDVAQRGRITLGDSALRAGDIAVLVRSHAEGSLARQALAALGVGSVELSQASVFHSPDAEDLERLLAAVLEPLRERLLKTALATEAMGRDAAAIDALSADEAALLEAVQRFAGWRDTWLRRGVGVMLRQWLGHERVAARMLARGDGQRRLTNLLHLIECLHQASVAHPAPDALLRWLQTQRRGQRSTDETQLRLESDQNLVQIVTIHKSKGLEFPIVFCPFLWTGRIGPSAVGLDGVEYHDDEGRTVVDYRQGFAGEFDEAGVHARVRLEDSAESLRLIYVALTRAAQRCVLVAGCYATVSWGRLSTTQSARSLLNWLVAGAGQSPASWSGNKLDATAIAASWQALAERCGPQLAVGPLPPGAGTPLPASRARPEMLDALAPPRQIPPGWRIGSYTGLVSRIDHGAIREPAAVDHDLRVSTGKEPAAHASLRLDDDDILRFARGAAAGECLHAVFERVCFTDPTGWPAAIAAALRRRLPGRPERARDGGVDIDALRARMLMRMLDDVLGTPLPVGTRNPLRLAALPGERRLNELEFHLPSHRLEASALNDALSRLGYAVPRLGFAALRGFLKGYIDLVLEHDGRFFVLDWKSNHLGDRPADYASAPIEHEMAAQGYHLQSLLYCVALDRYLKHRLPHYRCESHFGGSIYLFVRGVRPHWKADDGRPAGLHFHRPAPQAIQALSALFEPDEVLA